MNATSRARSVSGGGIGRRDIFGLLAGAAMWPSLARGRSSARATTSNGSLQRLLVLFATQGTVHSTWRMAPADAPDDKAWEFDLAGVQREAFSRCLEPLYAVREHILALDGLSLPMTQVFGVMPHHTGHAVALSGARPTLDGDYVTRVAGPSIDQLIAAQHPDPGPIGSLHYGQSFRPVCHDRTGAPIPSETDPALAFARLFPGPQDPQTLAGRRSVLDLVARQTDRMRARLGADDRRKLEQHQQMIRDLERQLETVQALACGPVVPPPEEPSDPVAAIDWHADAFTDLAITALACGHSRVATVYDPGPSCAYLGLECGNIHQDHAHVVGLLPEATEVMTDFCRYYARRLANVVQRLAAIPDGEQTLLDSTLVVLANELGSPNHDFWEYPLVLAGGSNHFRTGRYLHWPATDRITRPYGEVLIGPAHNRALVSVVRAFGIDTQQVGVDHVTGLDGNIDVTGALDRLT